MQAVQADKEHAYYNKEKTEEDKGAAKIGHSMNILGGGQKRGGFAKKFGWLAGFGEDANRTTKPDGLLAYILEVGVKASQKEDVTAWKLPRYVVDQVEAVASRHRDVAKQKMGSERPGTDETILRGINSLRFKTTLSEDESECVCHKAVVVDDEDSLHSDLLF
jgi:hypothetical protein